MIQDRHSAKGMARQMLGRFEHAGRHGSEAIGCALFFQREQHGPAEWTAGDAMDDEFDHGYSPLVKRLQMT
jgi:hypothetical protein